MPHPLAQWGTQFLKNRAPAALVGLAGAATIGFASSGGQVDGVSAGIGGALSGGSSGAFSGALLGIGAGAGLVAAGSYSKTLRPHVGRWIGKALSSAPVQSLGKMATNIPLGSQWAPGQKALGSFMGQTHLKFLNPQKQAASFLISMLENKQMQYRWAAGVGGVGGLVAGGVGGMGVGAWQGGARQRGPMG